MKTETKVVIGIIGLLTLFLVFSLFTTCSQKEETSVFSSADSIQIAQNKVKSDSLQNIVDSLNKRKPITITRIKYVKGRDTLIYIGKDTACIEVIKRKDERINALDSAVCELDLEARIYSDLLLLSENKNGLILKRFAALSFKKDSIIIQRGDSITAIRKTSYKQLKKEKRTTLFYKVTTTLATALGIYGTIR